MEINNIYDKYFIQYQHNINFAAFKKKNVTRCVCETQMPPIMANSKGGHARSQVQIS